MAIISYHHPPPTFVPSVTVTALLGGAEALADAGEQVQIEAPQVLSNSEASVIIVLLSLFLRSSGGTEISGATLACLGFDLTSSYTLTLASKTAQEDGKKTEKMRRQSELMAGFTLAEIDGDCLLDEETLQMMESASDKEAESAMTAVKSTAVRRVPTTTTTTSISTSIPTKSLSTTTTTIRMTSTISTCFTKISKVIFISIYNQRIIKFDNIVQ